VKITGNQFRNAGSNKMRFIPYQASTEKATTVAYTPAKSTWREQYEKSLALGGAAALGVVAAGLHVSFFRKKRRKRHEA